MRSVESCVGIRDLLDTFLDSELETTIAAEVRGHVRLARIGARPEAIARAEGALRQTQGRLAFARSQLEATVIRAPVSGTILERTAEKGELVTAQFASAAAGGRRIGPNTCPSSFQVASAIPP